MSADPGPLACALMPAPPPDAVCRPGLLDLLLEWRAPAEFWAGVASFAFLSHWPRGDGHPVLLFPGLIASDASTLLLRQLLRRLGYAPHGWAQGFNLGPRHGVVAGCLERLEEIADAHGGPVSLIGWSLGGIYAREAAKLRPALVRQVITLGSPFRGNPEATHAYPIYRLVNGRPVDPALLARLAEPPPVPVTSIFSRSDGIVPWQLSVQEPGVRAESIEVHASHLGLGFHPAALYAIADRLQHDASNWRPFAPGVRAAAFYFDPHR